MKVLKYFFVVVVKKCGNNKAAVVAAAAEGAVPSVGSPVDLSMVTAS